MKQDTQTPDEHTVAAPSLAVETEEPSAPIESLSAAQKRVLVDLLFAGEMTRKRMFYIAEGYKDVPGQTIDVLFREGLAKLTVSRNKDPKGRFLSYRYAVTITRRGEWFAHAIMQAEHNHQETIEALSAGLKAEAGVP